MREITRGKTFGIHSKTCIWRQFAGTHSGLRIADRDNSIHKGLRTCIVPAHGISWDELQNSTWRGRRFWADHNTMPRIHAFSSEPTFQSLRSNSWRNNWWTSHWSSNRENSWPIWTWNCSSITQWYGTDILCYDFQRKESVRGWSPYSQCRTQIHCRMTQWTLKIWGRRV